MNMTSKYNLKDAAFARIVLPCERKRAMQLAHLMQRSKDNGQDIDTGKWLSKLEQARHDTLARILERVECEIEELEAVVGEE